MRSWMFRRSSPGGVRVRQGGVEVAQTTMDAARAVSGPTLLTRMRSGMYRCYTCSTKARQSQRGGRGLTVWMDKLDRAVVDHPEGGCSIQRV